MSIDPDLAVEHVLAEGDEWRSWRALRLSGEAPGEPPPVPEQDVSGAFPGASGRASPGATGEAICHLVVLGLDTGPGAGRAAAWLEDARTPAAAWLDPPEAVPGEVEDPAAGRVWATASAACALLALRRQPGARALGLLRGEADMEGRLTGGAYPTFAAAGAYWLAEGPQTEMAEWGLRWAREWTEDWWGPWERTSALAYWGAAGIPPEHPSVDAFLAALRDESPREGWRDDLELTLRVLEMLRFFEE
ncbi:MAG: hypothetical protein ABR575_11770 [Actinomycetota bacterium]